MDSLKWDKQFALDQAAEDVELLQELIDIFKESCSNDFKLIELGLKNNDAKAICSAAHSIKGAAASLGIEGIREVAMAVEEDSRSGSLEVARQQVETLAQMVGQVQQL